MRDKLNALGLTPRSIALAAEIRLQRQGRRIWKRAAMECDGTGGREL